MTNPLTPVPPDDPSATPPPSENVVISIVHDIGAGIGSVVDAIHDLTETPLDAAKEHMDNVTELQAEFISALSHGDVDGATHLLAQADAELQAGVDALNPDAKDAHQADAHFGDLHLGGDA